MKCTSVEVFKKDGFPLNICNDCLEKLKSAYNFKEMVLQSHKQLHQYIQKIMEEKRGALIKEEHIVAENHLFHSPSEICTSIDFNNSKSSETGCKIIEEEREVSVKEEHDIVENNIPEVSSEIYPSYQPFASIDCWNLNFPETGCKGLGLKQEDTEDVTSYNYGTSIAFENENKVELDIESSDDMKCISLITTTDFSINYGATENSNPSPIIKRRKLRMELNERDESNSLVYSNECNNTLTVGDSLGRHLDTRPGNLLFKCKECNREYVNKHFLRKHAYTHSLVARFPCVECGKMFKYKHHVERHKKIHKTEGPYKCDLCNKTFKLLTALRRHSETCSIHTNIESDGMKCISLITTTDFSVNYGATENSNPSPMTKTRKFGMELNEKGKSDDVVYSNECNKTLTLHDSAGRCLSTRPENLPFKCKQCDRRFANKDLLRKHVNTHGLVARFPCDECGKMFKYRRHVEFHKASHKTERPYECDICNKTFKLLKALRRHQITHTEGKAKYVCEICDRAFAEIRSLNNHKGIHISPDDRSFICKTCSKSFGSDRSLKKHMKTHSNDKPHICTYCERSFRYKWVLKKHVLIHTNEKPFPCKVCEKTFRQKATLSNHMRTHTEVTSYLCKLCHTFLQSSRRLLTHMRKAHGKEYQGQVKQAKDVGLS
ncbi:hypothetical protein Trydic_g23447 [Trypoxylus dichotomus]